jgi:hypothetical protein
LVWTKVKGVLLLVLLVQPWSATMGQSQNALRLPDVFARPGRVRIYVTVRNWQDQAVMAAKVRLKSQSMETAGSTDADGRYTFDDLAPGEYSIVGEGTDGLPSNQSKLNFTPGAYGVHLSFPNRPVCPYHYGETTVKCLDAAQKQFVGDDAVDCGKGYVSLPSSVKPITKCVHKNLKRHMPFVARYEVPTTDSYHVDAFVGDSNGHVHALMYDSNGIWDLPEEFEAITRRISKGLYSGGVYVFVDDCSKPRTNLFDWKWAPVPCKQKTR